MEGWTEFSRVLACPYCQHEIEPDLSVVEEWSTFTYECPECHKVFGVYRISFFSVIGLDD